MPKKAYKSPWGRAVSLLGQACGGKGISRGAVLERGAMLCMPGQREALRAVFAGCLPVYANDARRLTEEQLAGLEQRAAARGASLPRPSKVEREMVMINHLDRIPLASMQVEMGCGITAIARLQRKPRSSNYAAFRLFLELPDEMPAAIRKRLCSSQAGKASAAEPAGPRITNRTWTPSASQPPAAFPPAAFPPAFSTRS